MKKTVYPPRFWPALIVFSLVGQIAWVVENMYFNVFVYKMFGASAGAISAMVAASAVSAAVTTVLIGALSDKLGRRRVFICGGYILWGLTIAAFALLRTDVISALFPMAVSVPAVAITLVIVLDCVMTFFGSSANDAAFNAWLTDAAPESGRGAAEGVNAMMPLLAILVVFGGFMAFDLDRPESWTAIFLIIGAVVLVIGVFGFFLISESGHRDAENSSCFRNILYGFRPSVVRANPLLYLTLAAFAVFGISIQIFMPYLILYYNVSLGMDDYVLIMAPAIVLAAIVTAVYGRVYDKVGFMRSVIPPLAMLCGGYVVLYFFRQTLPVFVGSLLMMCGYLTGMAVFGAMLRDRTPAGKAGMFQGLRIVAQVLIPGVIGPVIGAAVLKDAEMALNTDGTYSFIPNERIFAAALIAAVCLLPLLWLIARRLSRKEAAQ